MSFASDALTLDWNPIGPRFSNNVLQALVVLFGKRPPKDRRLLILATTSHRSILSDMDVESAFDTDIPVHNIATIHAIEQCLQEVQLFTRPEDHARAIKMLHSALESGVSVGVKKLLGMAEMARQDPDPAAQLVSSLLRIS